MQNYWISHILNLKLFVTRSLTVVMQVLDGITHYLPSGSLLAVGGLRAVAVQVNVRRFQIVDLFGIRTGTVLGTSQRGTTE